MVTTMVQRRPSGVLTDPIIRVLLLAAVLSGCGDWFGADTESGAETGQTIARVNGQEITRLELATELRNTGSANTGQQSAIARDVLRQIIQRTVLAQSAVNMKLDRTPEVMIALRRARANVLAQAYIVDRLEQQLPVSKYDIDDFIEQHPNYFSERKHYIFDQLLIPKDLVTKNVIEAIEDLGTLDEVEQVLAGMHIDYSRRLNANLGNQFPRSVIYQIEALKPNEIFFIRTKDYAIVSSIIDSRLQPVTGKAAGDMAKRILVTKRNASAIRKITDDLLVNARIVLLGDFADMQIFEPDPALKEDQAAVEASAKLKKPPKRAEQ